MRVLEKRFFALLDPESTRLRRHGGPSPISSARSTTSGRQVSGSAGCGNGAGDGTVKSARSVAPCPGKEPDPDECSAFDLLHTEKGFVAFEQWYQRVLANCAGGLTSSAPPAELGLLWPQAFCPPNALHEHAFTELLRAFAECTDGEACDFFDLLNYDCQGYLGYAQVYLAICLIAAMASRQLTKCLYFHSTRLFGVLAKGCRFDAPPDYVTWPRLLALIRLLGAPSHLISRAGAECGVAPLAQLTYEEFLEIMYPVVVELDRGLECGEITVINENDRMGSFQLMNNVRSRTCQIL
mmetsp:Transcript_102785/g.299791  ORF Transcript_102785/g.299791 Transcript_102785/m.299791 type:complete len:296 (-) Transcript_102785:91-978(-)